MKNTVYSQLTGDRQKIATACTVKRASSNFIVSDVVIKL